MVTTISKNGILALKEEYEKEIANLEIEVDAKFGEGIDDVESFTQLETLKKVVKDLEELLK